MRTLYKIDENGFMLYGEEIFLLEDELTPDDGIYVGKPLPTNELGHQLPFQKIKWDGTQWIEGETEEEKNEREAQQLLESLKPSPNEIANAELEIKIVTMLTELEVIQ
ncbi:hypothetical protein [Lysinibacillus sp. ZYM-1]|uniref:hypothetical protein n=1 Tax=Lysinibacillus sp. ZYM-1 TaxID=1681184 RepID=UPI0006CE846F|nr:hypothetical protein [Lysinibacillus sp. ZYM-1]KPN95272.1 hypothetical protein AO843_03580 [Lysinibacillus sp. ZYM-1]